jgi:hypothetical protein
MPADAQEPLYPTRPRVRINNATIESLMQELAQHPRGFLLHRDELAGWLGDFNRYGGNGGDRGQYLEMFGGRSSSVDRKSLDRTLFIKHMHLSIIGGIQPDRLDSILLQGDDDGLQARFLMLWPEPVGLTRATTTPDDRPIERAFHRLRGLRFVGEEPITIPFSNEAAEAMWTWQRKHHAASAAAAGRYGSALGKFPGYVARIALVLEHLWWAVSETEAAPSKVEARAVKASADLVDEYFAPMLARILGEEAITQSERAATLLARAIIDRKAETLNIRTVKREWRVPGLMRTAAVDAAVHELVEARWLVRSPNQPTTGRRNTTYIVRQEIRELWAKK